MVVIHPDYWRVQFDAHKAVICVLDVSSTIVYCNPAWDQFAHANNGESAIAARICGTPLMRYVPRALQYHYAKLLERAREKHELVTADYECNSADRFRKFCMHISPIPATSLLAVVHLLLAHGEIPYPAFSSADHDYGIRELAMMCAQCRRTKRLHDNSWDWVREFIRTPPAHVLYGICEECLVRYCSDAQT